MVGISVIICCYNSAARLPNTLEHLFAQTGVAAINWEIILVNNNSADQTEQVAQKVWDLHGQKVPLVIIREKKPGLSFARKAGIYAARYDYILFCDDDNWLDAHYISNVYQQFLADASGSLAMIGGQGIPVTETGESLPIEWYGYFACGDQQIEGKKPSEIYLYGAGLALRKEVVLMLFTSNYPFVLEDRKGKLLTSGGDTELSVLLGFLGFRIKYCSGLTFRHYIPQSRLSKSYFKKLQLGTSVSFHKLIPTLYKIDGKSPDAIVWFKDIVYQIRLLFKAVFTSSFSIHMVKVRWFTLATVIKNYREYKTRAETMMALKNRIPKKTVHVIG